MQQNRRVVNLFVAATMISILAFAIFLFDNTRLPSVLAAQLSAIAQPPEAAAADATTTTDLSMLQAENSALRATIQTMQEREVEFQTVIEKANRSLQALESTASTQLSAADNTTTTLDQRNQELKQAVQLLQDRETQFRTQIDSANQTIHGLEGSLQQHKVTVQTLQGQNAELVRAVQVMQERERQYQAQLQAATQALQNQTAVVAGNSNQSSSADNQSYTEYEEHEEHEEQEEHYEHEEHEDDDD